MKKRICYLFFMTILLSLLTLGNTSQAKPKNYTISPKSKIKWNYKKSPNRNKYTQHYFLLRSYLEKMEKNGGGTLTLKKGTYKICNSLYVPRNVTILFKNGVCIKKTKKTGKAQFKSAESIFQVVTPKLSKKKKKTKKYNGSRNVKFIGQGTATIDLAYVKNAKGIIAAHCQNVQIENIHFTNMNTGHFLEIDAAKNLTVRNCRFTNASRKSPYNKEAINIDTPDALTGGLTLSWSKPDKTPNQNIVIENCSFSNLQRGVGTHKYSQKKVNGKWALNCYHENMIIRNNTFSNIKETAIFMMNWKNVNIAGNTFIKDTFCLNFRGVQAPFQVSANNFGSNTVTLAYNGKKANIHNKAYRNSQKGSVYSAIYNRLGITTIAQLVAMNNRK